MRQRLVFLLVLCGSIDLSAQPYQYFVPVIGQTRGATASYLVRLFVTNLSSKDTGVSVENVFTDGSGICRRRDFGTPVLFQAGETQEFTYVGCEHLASMSLSSGAPLAVLADIEETPYAGSPRPPTSQTVPIGSTMFPSNSEVVIPLVDVVSFSSSDPVRANLFVTAGGEVGQVLPDSTVTITSFRDDGNGHRTSSVQTVSVRTGRLTVIPLADVPAQKIVVSVNAPFYAAASVVRGSHGVFRPPYPAVP
jgi:hypothetical protein